MWKPATIPLSSTKVTSRNQKVYKHLSTSFELGHRLEPTTIIKQYQDLHAANIKRQCYDAAM